MRLVSVTLKNFRCYKDEKTIEIGDLTAFIGRNDIGKSSVLEALEIYFNNGSVKLDNGDCSVSATDQVIEIICGFSNFPDRLVLDAQAETTLANEYLLAANGNLYVKRPIGVEVPGPRKRFLFVRVILQPTNVTTCSS